MAGLERLSRENARALATGWRSEFKFGLISLVLLAAAAIAVAVLFPEVHLLQANLVGL